MTYATHTPVLLEEVLAQLEPKPGQIIIDATFGGGGHSRELLKRVAPDGKVIGLDRDPIAIDIATHGYKKDIDAGRLVLVQARFSELRNVTTELGVDPIDAVLIDAGISSMQLLHPERGFSFSGSAPLDMRMDKQEDLTAARILAEWSEEELRDQLRLVDERAASRLARAIVAARKISPLEKTDQLVALAEKVVGKGRSKVQPATKLFLALRIAVNHELEELKNGMNAALQALKPGGRLAVISFHSTEDRIIKQLMNDWTRDCICPPELPVCRCDHPAVAKVLTKKPITPSEHELSINPRARSAKLRTCSKL